MSDGALFAAMVAVAVAAVTIIQVLLAGNKRTFTVMEGESDEGFAITVTVNYRHYLIEVNRWQWLSLPYPNTTDQLRITRYEDTRIIQVHYVEPWQLGVEFARVVDINWLPDSALRKVQSKLAQKAKHYWDR